MYLNLKVVVHFRTRTQYRSLHLAVESKTCISSYLELVSWMYLHLRVDVHSRTQ
ncbi:unnamed protein product [Schistosoma curassoni]|uniref:Ovule protein n=1 Tax=Schistosoma curassoni TaxID=6186 RepID=A0A183JCF9_9TREM|nr:unnamed protein product [Schistosoma curassoni]